MIARTELASDMTQAMIVEKIVTINLVASESLLPKLTASDRTDGPK